MYNVRAKDSEEAVGKVEEYLNKKEVKDDRLSPMTYRKLKELGYNENQ